MARFQLHEARPPHRRLAQFDSDVDPTDEQACVALLRRTAPAYKRKPSEVILRWTGGRRIVTYRA